MILFVTGTDTGVGKTTVSCALLAAARAEGRSARGIKLIESGCTPTDHGLRAEDAEALAEAAGHSPDVLFRYQLPLAPEAAAREADVPYPDLDRCVAHVQAASRDAGDGLVLVEAAGGLLVPLTPDATVADLARRIGAPLLVVARDNLGTINHTALTLEVARGRALEVIAFVFSSTNTVSRERAEANAAAVTALSGVAFGGCLPLVEHRSELEAAASAIALPEPI